MRECCIGAVHVDHLTRASARTITDREEDIPLVGNALNQFFCTQDQHINNPQLLDHSFVKVGTFECLSMLSEWKNPRVSAALRQASVVLRGQGWRDTHLERIQRNGLNRWRAQRHSR